MNRKEEEKESHVQDGKEQEKEELERTFLVTYLPVDIEMYSSKEIIDIYLPPTEDHPKLRLRKNGDKYQITRKEPKAADSSEFIEENITLSQSQFEYLAQLPGKQVRKIRYAYYLGEQKVEIDVFQDDLIGLVLADFEFSSIDQKNSFTKPDFCAQEITSEPLLGGGSLAGKRYSDIEGLLTEKYTYQPLFIS